MLLDFNIGFRVEPSSNGSPQNNYHVRITRWDFSVYDLDEREIIVYHWHPESLSDRKYPHLHIGSVLIDSRRHELGKTFSRLHIPTGIITIADVAKMLIEEFGVIPIHRQWDETLHACQAEFERQRSLS